MTALTIRNRISIAEICFYTPSLFVALYLTARHGLGRNAAWVYLVIFSVIRISGAGLELATISHPASIPIYTGSLILQNVGISPLMLVMMGLLSRVLVTVRKTRQTVLKPSELRLIQLLIFLGLIFVIVGGVKAGNIFKKTFEFHLPVEGEAGLGLIISGYGFLVLAAIWITRYASHIVDGEKRLLLAVWLSFPFILVRIIYGCLGTYTKNAKFNQLTGDGNYFLGMAIVMEMMVVVICAPIGLTLESIPFSQQVVEFRELREGLLSKARTIFHKGQEIKTKDVHESSGDEQLPETKSGEDGSLNA